MYILPRWTKHAKKEVWEKIFNDTNKFYNLVLKTQHDEDARKIVEDLYAKACDSFKNSTMQENSIQECQSQRNVHINKHIVLDPEKFVTKGRKKRIKGHFEKRNSHNKH